MKITRKHFTKVTPFSKFLAFVLFIILPFLGFWFGMQYQKALDTYTNTLSRIPQTSGTHSTINIQMADIGRTLYVHIGDTIVLDLPQNFDWNVSISPVENMSPLNSQMPLQYKAVKQGTVTISANGRPACKAGQLCSQLAVAFKSFIVVAK